MTYFIEGVVCFLPIVTIMAHQLITAYSGIVVNELEGQTFEGDQSKGEFVSGDDFIDFYGMSPSHKVCFCGYVCVDYAFID